MSLIVARQPILDPKKNTYAYELLFRSSYQNGFGNAEPDQACVQAFHESMADQGLDSLVGGSKAFYNLTRHSLLGELYSVLPNDKVVLEVLDKIEPDDEVLESCKKLKKAGYSLAVDDLIMKPKFEPFMDMADIVKVNFSSTSPEQRETMAERYSGRKLQLLAEGVESEAQFQEASDLGYEYFQGYFFCQPEMLAGSEIPQFKTHYLEFLQEVQKTPIDLDRVEAIIKKEMSLSVTLLRMLNSAAFQLTTEVTSIRRALVILGEERLRKWASVVAMAGLGDDKPSELVITGLTRAQFCEFLAEPAGLSDRSADLFLAGMLSIVDALVGRPMPDVLSQLSISEDVKDALLEDEGLLSTVIALSRHYERGEWQAIANGSERLGIDGPDMVDAYRRSVAHTIEVFQGAA